MKNKYYLKQIFCIFLLAILINCFANVIVVTGAEGWLWPVPGHTSLSRGFSSGHMAIDINDGNIAGADIVATKSGVIKRWWNDCQHVNAGDKGCNCSWTGSVSNGFGNGIVIQHDDGTISSYAHMMYDSIPAQYRQVGARVQQGAVIGRVGSAGWSTGYHLHFSISSSGDYWENQINNNPDNINYIYGNNPQGFLDSASGGKGYVDVSGWALDKDSPNTSIHVHVYVGGPAGSGAPCYAITADKVRTDVNSAYGVNGNHGFSARIYTNKTGNQPIYVYGINVGGGQNTLLSSCPKTVNIQAAAQPVISDVSIMEQDSQGYVVQCKVSSESEIDRVQFPTWTLKNNQDDLAANWETNSAVKGYKVGDYYRFRVNISAHNNEYGTYVTDIYAYDKSGNKSASVRVGVTVQAGAMPQEIVKFGDSLISVFEENMTWTQMNQFAEKMGSTLVSIPNPERQSVIYDLVKDRFRSYYSVGGYVTLKGGQWYWTAGDNFWYSNWDDNQPDCANNKELYLAVVTSNGKWNDLPADYTNNGFIMATPLNLEANAVVETSEKIYKFYNVSMSYNLARRFCEENGGRLVCIGSKEENDILAAKAKELNYKYFIGATDEETEGNFKWVSGQPMSYQNWASGEPNNDMASRGGEDYVNIYTDGTWNDSCGQVDGIGFIAEFDKTVISSPTPSENPSPSVPDEFDYGDVDQNGMIDVADALNVLKFVVKLEVPNGQQEKAADVDANGIVDVADALTILKKVVKLIDKFPAELN